MSSRISLRGMLRHGSVIFECAYQVKCKIRPILRQHKSFDIDQVYISTQTYSDIERKIVLYASTVVLSFETNKDVKP